MKILLVGESEPLLRILQVVSSRAGYQADVATTEALVRAGCLEQPDLLIFDHINPMDLYSLNPRLAGFGGAVLVLTDSEEPTIVTGLLQTPHVLQKPFHLDAIVQRLQQFSRRLQGCQAV